jgi:hypothetical protein
MNTATILTTPRDCQSLYSCWKFTLLFGWSGDFGPTMEQGLSSQWLFYFLYDLAIRFVLLNVVRGITVDTFSELRELKIERLRDTKETCFICGIDKQVFDRDKLSRGFNVHIKEEHNLWNYIYFIIYLWEQDKDDDDGLEHYVRRCVAGNDITWMPSHTSLCLSSKDSIGGDTSGVNEFDITTTQEIFQTDLNHLQTNFHSKINSLQQELQGALLELKTDLEQNSNIHQLHPREQPQQSFLFQSSPLVSSSRHDEVNNKHLSSIQEIVRPSTTPHLFSSNSSSLHPQTKPTLKKANTLTDLSISSSISSYSSSSKKKKSPNSLMLTLEIQQILGLQYPSRVLDTIQCVIRFPSPLSSDSSQEIQILEEKIVSFDETTLTARPGSSSGNSNKRPIITFNPVTILLTNNYQQTTERAKTVLIQITYGSNPMRYIGSVSLTFEELILHTQQQQLQQQGQQLQEQQEQKHQLHKYFRGDIRNQICRGTLILTSQVKESS